MLINCNYVVNFTYSEVFVHQLSRKNFDQGKSCITLINIKLI